MLPWSDVLTIRLQSHRMRGRSSYLISISSRQGMVYTSIPGHGLEDQQMLRGAAEMLRAAKLEFKHPAPG